MDGDASSRPTRDRGRASDDVLIAERLDGRRSRLTTARLVSPRQYGYINTQRLCRIELHTAEPTTIHAAHPVSRVALRGPLIRAHPRERVWEEERHRSVPPWLLRPLYRLTISFGVRLGRS
jgi:DMSO/TMAO reductase YedYZ molybdopterin-dependent catalytic subunit